MPPATPTLSEAGGLSRNQGSFRSALNSVLTPVTKVISSVSKALRRFDRGRGFGIRTLWPDRMKKPRKFTVKAKIW